MTWFADNWFLMVGAAALGILVIYTVCDFAHKPTDAQIASIKEWLLYAVSCAEKELGSGTGKLKLRQVYDAFCERFPWAAPYISFEQFRVWVDEALLTMRRLIAEGGSVKTFIEG